MGANSPRIIPSIVAILRITSLAETSVVRSRSLIFNSISISLLLIVGLEG